jgi:hypothetical protein
MTSYLASGEYRDRYLGVRIPQTNIQPEHLSQAREFGSRLVDRVFGKPPSGATGANPPVLTHG